MLRCRGRKNIWLFNVAGDYYGGLILFFVITIGIILHVKVVLFSEAHLAENSTINVFLDTFVVLFLAGATNGLLFLVMVSDPGLLSLPNDLSCRCRFCDIEVDDFDHHCGILGACIGRGNLCYFVLFLFFVTLLCFIAGMQIICFVLSRVSYLSVKRFLVYSMLKENIRALLGQTEVVWLFLSGLGTVYGGLFSFCMLLVYTHLCYTGAFSHQRRWKQYRHGTFRSVFENVMHPRILWRSNSFDAVFSDTELL